MRTCVGRPSTKDTITGMMAMTVCAADGSTEVAGVVAASLIAFSGRVETWQQEPLPEGISESCAAVVCPARIIIGHSSPQWWPVVTCGLQFASPMSGLPKSTTLSINATSLKRLFISFDAMLSSAVTPVCDYRHVG